MHLGVSYSKWFLTKQSIRIAEDGTYMELTLPASKTDPFRKGITLTIIASTSAKKKSLRPANRVHVRTPSVHPARPIRLVRLNSPFIALWGPLRCNTPHFCSFLCGSVCSPLPPLTPSIYFLPSSLRPMTSHFCSFLCGSVRSPLPPDAIHLPPYRFSCTP